MYLSVCCYDSSATAVAVALPDFFLLREKETHTHTRNPRRRFALTADFVLVSALQEYADTVNYAALIGLRRNRSGVSWWAGQLFATKIAFFSSHETCNFIVTMNGKTFSSGTRELFFYLGVKQLMMLLMLLRIPLPSDESDDR